MKPAEPASRALEGKPRRIPALKGKAECRFAHSMKVVPRKALFVLFYRMKRAFFIGFKP